MEHTVTISETYGQNATAEMQLKQLPRSRFPDRYGRRDTTPLSAMVEVAGNNDFEFVVNH